MRRSHLGRYTGGPAYTLTEEERFWAKVDKNGPVVREELGPCWIWTAGKLRGGYGYFYNKTDICAHRYSYRIKFGPIPDELYALHKCDTKSCVQPDHIFLGTQKDNMDDFWGKGRTRDMPKGAAHPRSKLTENDVIDIRTLTAFGANRAELARAYGVSWPVIDGIVRRKGWKHVP